MPAWERISCENDSLLQYHAAPDPMSGLIHHHHHRDLLEGNALLQRNGTRSTPLKIAANANRSVV
jgi:hypothetical protein